LTKEFAAQEIEFEDEMRVGTRTELGKRWMPQGTRPIGKQKIGYEYCYLYVSLKPFTGELFAMLMPRLNKQCFGIFIAERSKQLESEMLMIADGASAHRLEKEGKIKLGKLPAYSPELNPVERFFQELRRRMKFRVFETIEEVEQCLSEILKEFYEDAERVKSLTLYPYIKYARNHLT
jgi:hypothetical protein